MIGLKESVPAAISFVKGLYPEAKDIRLEQVEPQYSAWSVLISFEIGEPTALSSVIGGDRRLYKAVQIDQESGEPLSLTVWKQ